MVAAAPRLVDLLAEGKTMQIYDTDALTELLLHQLDGTTAPSLGLAIRAEADGENPNVLHVDLIHQATRYHHNFKVTVEFTHVDAD